MVRQVSDITYTLTRKRVKNINMRIGADGAVRVSASPRVSEKYIDQFVVHKAQWIERARERVQKRQQIRKDNFDDRWTKEECLAFFEKLSDKFYPLFSHILKEKPTLKVRLMKTRWGVCHIAKNTITLNKRLMDKPLAVAEYVMLHEYVHFLHPNHQKGFHSTLQRLMPDYKQRRKGLKENANGSV